MKRIMKAFIYGLAFVAFSIPAFAEEQKSDRAIIPPFLPR